YNGPDTGHLDTVIPGQVLFCDPVVPSCVQPELDSCKAFSPSCGGAPAPAPALVAVPPPAPASMEPSIPPGWTIPKMMEAVAGTPVK
ncbi:unnamed protein product, partial [Symbiodinium necroappetens]